MSQITLQREIIGHSIADGWQDACEEWSLHSIFRSVEPRTCLCGHRPIREVCILINKFNGEEEEVGNCCVEHILSKGSKNIFRSLNRVVEDNGASFNRGVLELAYDRKLINDCERDFYYSIWRKRILSSQQAQQKLEINERILSRFVHEE